MTLETLPRSFFQRPTITVAQELLGTELVCGEHSGIITETEAYIGQDDEACHASKGRTPRTEVMFGEAGYSYVYLIYGMYYCLNVVTEAKDFPAAVLIRGIKTNDKKSLTDGPGKLCRYLNITKEHNALDVTQGNKLYIKAAIDHTPPPYQSTPRIGISKSTDKLWRFVAS